jgi:3-hydroxyisobutyrate dehydrogenase-like beta-hydroxyacid dehydrogenase
MSLPSVLFIGIGNMGQPMAINLARAGYSMLVSDLDRGRAGELEALGAVWTDDLVDAAARVDVVMLSLPGPAQVRDVLLGARGVLAAMREGATLIDTSTSSTELAREIGAIAADRHIDYLEAPVTNAIDGAAAGRLTIFVGAETTAFERCRSLLGVLGNRVLHVGSHGNGATVKLLTNLMWFVHAATVGEALMLGAKAGVPLDTVREALMHSAGSSWVVEHDVPSIFAGHYDPSFSLALCCKDLKLVNDIASEQGYELTMGRHAQTVFERARQVYGDDAAELHVVRLLEERAGLFLRPPHGQAAANDEAA